MAARLQPPPSSLPFFAPGLALSGSQWRAFSLRYLAVRFRPQIRQVCARAPPSDKLGEDRTGVAPAKEQ